MNVVAPLSCPECGQMLSEVLEFVTEQRQYRFSLDHNDYIGRSDPIDDTANLDYVGCPHCFVALPKSAVEEIFERYDAFSTSP